jgi:hypothetical protein
MGLALSVLHAAVTKAQFALVMITPHGGEQGLSPKNSIHVFCRKASLTSSF